MPSGRLVDDSPQTGSSDLRSWHHPGGKLVEKGAHSLRQDELLAVLIGSGVPGRPALAIANAVLDEYVGLYGMHQRASVEALEQIPGLGRRKAERIVAAIELGRRLHRALGSRNTTSNSQAGLFPHIEVRGELSCDGPTEAELLARIVGSGVRGRPSALIAGDILKTFDSLIGLFGQDMGCFLAIEGLNSVKIIRIVAALEIARRVAHALS